MNKRNVWHLYLRQQIYLALERGTANSEAVNFRVAHKNKEYLMGEGEVQEYRAHSKIDFRSMIHMYPPTDT